MASSSGQAAVSRVWNVRTISGIGRHLWVRNPAQSVFHALDQTRVLARTSAIKTCSEDRDDLENILSQVFLERGVVALVQNDNLDAFGCAERDDELCSEA